MLGGIALADREKWDKLHAAASEHAAPAWLERFSEHLPSRGAALDLAAGSGRIACWAAERGPLELDSCLPAGPFALVTVFHYRQPEEGWFDERHTARLIAQRA